MHFYVLDELIESFTNPFCSLHSMTSEYIRMKRVERRPFQASIITLTAMISNDGDSHQIRFFFSFLLVFSSFFEATSRFQANLPQMISSGFRFPIEHIHFTVKPYYRPPIYKDILLIQHTIFCF